ncbi:hypothetical protein [Pedobacter kyungheensis]|nr:hypothetical protein [Pedobacter kyungheensis]
MTDDTIVQAGLIAVLAISAGLILRKINLPSRRRGDEDNDEIHWL